MLLFRTKATVKVGQLHRYSITYKTALDNISPLPKSLFLKIKNTESFPLRAAYLNGPFILYVDVRPHNYDPFVSVTEPRDYPIFEPQLKPAQSFHAELKLDAQRSEHRWTIDVVSQLIFSSSATVGFELSLGRDPDSLQLEADEGIFSNSLKVVHQDTAAIWSSPAPDPTKPVHLVVISHGLHSNTGADMLFVKEQIDKAAALKGENVIVRGYFDNVCRTERGVKYLGKRMAQYIATSLREPNINKISFVGHSLGGLVMTYAIAYIHVHYPDFFEKIEPINFVALATPFLGLSNENPLYVKFALDFGVVGKSGKDLGLTWKPSSPFKSSIESKPLLRILPTGPAAEILKRFHRRTVYANAVNDGIVPLRTSALLFLDWRGLAKSAQAQRGERVSDSHSNSQVDLKKAHLVDADGAETDRVEKNKDVPSSETQQQNTSNGSLWTDTLKPLQYAFSFLRPQAMKHKPSKIYKSSQTLDVSDDVDDDDERLVPLPKTSVLVSATSILNPPLPPMRFIVDVDSRPPTIFHDRLYRPEDLPKQHSKHKPDSSAVDAEASTAAKARVEEKIARAWHDHMTWRKVLVQLEPDAHNNIVVRRTFANAYGWPVIQHLVQHHFVDPYDPNEGEDSKKDEPVEADSEPVDDNTAMLNKMTRGSAISLASASTADSAKWDAVDFIVSDDSDEEYDESAPAQDAIASSSSISGRDEYSMQTLTDIVGYISEWSPMKIYNGMVGSDGASSKSVDTVTSTHTVTEEAKPVTE